MPLVADVTYDISNMLSEMKVFFYPIQFEYQQAQLEAEIENLSWKVERADSYERGSEGELSANDRGVRKRGVWEVCGDIEVSRLGLALAGSTGELRGLGKSEGPRKCCSVLVY